MIQADEYLKDRTTVTESGCWVWNGYKNSNGYAHSKLNKIRRLAHRFSYETYKGKIPDGMQVDHLCRVRNCVNPDHLEAVTPKENIARSDHASKKLSARTHCIRGHEYNTINTHTIKTVGGTARRCRVCHREYSRAWHNEHKVAVYARRRARRMK